MAHGNLVLLYSQAQHIARCRSIKRERKLGIAFGSCEDVLIHYMVGDNELEFESRNIWHLLKIILSKYPDHLSTWQTRRN
jgi:hypothetical protein